MKTGKLSYKEFTKRYFAEHEGATMQENAKAWNAYKAANAGKPEKAKPTQPEKPKPEEPKKEATKQPAAKLEVEPQGGGLLQQEQPKAAVLGGNEAESINTAGELDNNTNAPVGAPSLASSVTEDTYRALANSVHASLAGFVKIYTKGAVEVDEKDVNRLDNAAILLLKKYDTTGAVAEYGAEATYVLTLLDIGTRIYVETQLNKPKSTAPTGQNSTGQTHVNNPPAYKEPSAADVRKDEKAEFAKRLG